SAIAAPQKPAAAKKPAPAKPPARKQAPARPAAPRPSPFTAPADATSSPAYRYGQLSQVDCEAELKKRNIGFVRESARGVLAPVRLTGPLQGVLFRTDVDDKLRATTPWEIADCRLVLSLDDLAGILQQHGIVEVRHFSMYRPPAKGWPDGKIGTRHDGALALDAARFVGKDGTVLDVDKHFHGAIDAPTCGAKAVPRPATPEALELRAILCEAVDRRLFNVVLTPNYNRPHKNHFHLEVTEGVKWFLVH
ncbi:MAG TPA: extensin family protein, partial [Kofleriaceae bacterium]|nr:extensin family protein [Kofleriaceae bacterium]